MLKTLSILFFILVLISCETKKSSDGSNSIVGKVDFEFLDSLVVESLFELYLADKDESEGRLLFNERQMEQLIITDLEGKIISSFKPEGEGPDQVMSPLEVAFWREGVVIKEISTDHRFNFFDQNYNKVAQSPALTEGIHFLTIYNSHRSFSIIEKDGKTFIIGQEPNMLAEHLLADNSENPALYEKTKTGFIYDVGSEEITLINLYPKTWKIRLAQKWIGFKNSYIQASRNNKKVAVLPSVGDELFFYEFNGTDMTPVSQIQLMHPERKENIPYKPNRDYVLYPYFTQLFSGGNYFLAEFYTELPQEIFDSFRSMGEDFHMNPEYWDTLTKYRKVKYVLIDSNGNQGAITDLPVSGAVHFLDAHDILYVKLDSEKELDYNVFYRYKVTLK